MPSNSQRSVFDAFPIPPTPSMSTVLLLSAIFGHVTVIGHDQVMTLKPEIIAVACPIGCDCLTVPDVDVTCSSPELELSLPTFRVPNRTLSLSLLGHPLDLLSLSTAVLRDCHRLHGLTITGARLQSIAGLAGPDTLRRLDLSRNLLAVLPDRSFLRLLTVTELVLAANRIESIGVEAFYGLADLVELDLSGNRLGLTPDGSLAARWVCCLPGLERLNLTGNGLHVVPSRFFDCSVPQQHHRHSRRHSISREHPILHPTTTTEATTTVTMTTTPSPFLVEGRRINQFRDLDLSHNRIRHVYMGAFDGLLQYGRNPIERLRLTDNVLTTFPSVSSLSVTANDRRISVASTIDLSGNEFDVISGRTFADVERLERVILSRLDHVRLVERNAFDNLSSLVEIDLSGCGGLRYVDRHAFRALPALRVLDMSGSRLETLERSAVAIDSLPSLRTLDVTSSPDLRCDCITSWMRQDDRTRGASADDGDLRRIHTDPDFCNGTAHRLPNAADNSTTTTATSALSTASSRDAIAVISTSADVDDCSPRIVWMIDGDEVTTSVSDALRLDCIAVGPGPPSTSWRPPESTNTNDDGDDDNGSPVDVSNGTLLIRAVSSRHQGNYTCVATVAVDNASRAVVVDERTVQVRVRSSRVGLIALRTTVSTLTVTWRALDSSREYRVRYREENADGAVVPGIRGTFPVKPYMRSYTASDLHPDTAYEFCIEIRQLPTSAAIYSAGGAQDAGLPPFVAVSCSTLRTRDDDYRDRQESPGGALIRSRGMHVFVLAVAAVLSAALVLVLTAAVTRRYDNNRKRKSTAAGTSGFESSAGSSQIRLTTGNGNGSSWMTASERDVTFENRVALDASTVEQDTMNVVNAETDDYDYVPMFDSDDLEDIRISTSMQL